MTQEEFSPEKLVGVAAEVARQMFESMDEAEKVDSIRDVVAAFISSRIISVDPSSPGNSAEAALQMLAVCQLIPMVFPSAYNTAAIEVDIASDKGSVVTQLNRSLEL